VPNLERDYNRVEGGWIMVGNLNGQTSVVDTCENVTNMGHGA